MPSKILVLAGVSSGKSYWIEDPVLRVGSHPDADVCLPSPDLAHHAFTIEYRDQTFQVYNRGREQLTIGQQPIASGQTGSWSGGQELELSGGIKLLLEIDGDPAPCPQRRQHELEESWEEDAGSTSPADAPDAESTSGESSLKTGLQIAVIILCFVGILCVIAVKIMPQREQGSASSVEVPDFTTLILKAQEKQKKNPDLTPLIIRLQLAQQLKSQPQSKAASREYSRLRDELLARRVAKDPEMPDYLSFGSKVEEEMCRYVTHQLEVLEN